MKKLNKIFAALGTTAATIGAIPLALTSCGNSSTTTNNVRAAYTEATFAGSEQETTLYFTLDKPLADGEKLSIEVSNNTDKKFEFAAPVVKNTLISITVTKGPAIDLTLSEWTGSITFTCKNGQTTVWTEKIDDCYVGYSAVAIISDEAKAGKTAEGKTTHEFDFTIGIDLTETKSITAAVINVDPVSDANVTASLKSCSFNLEQKKVYVTVELQKSGTLYLNDVAYFNIELYGADADNKVIWHNTTKKMSLTYIDEIKRIPSGACTITQGGILSFTNPTSWTEDYNTLDLTATGFENVTGLAGDLVYVSGSIPTQLQKLTTVKFNSNCTKIGTNAFKGSNINTIDMSSLTNDAEKFYSGFFGTGSFANLTSTTGKLIYNPNWNAYKKSHINQALYKAGLYHTGWYDVTNVYNIAELREALEQGGNIKLLGDDSNYIIDEFDAREINVLKSSILDLNGHTIRTTTPIYDKEEQACGVLAVWDNAQLVIEDAVGTGGIKVDGTWDYVKEEGETDPEWFRQYDTFCIVAKTTATGRYSPQVHIEGGTYYGNRSCIYNSGAMVYIYKGDFHLNQKSVEFWQTQTSASSKGATYMLNCHGSTYNPTTSTFVCAPDKNAGQNVICFHAWGYKKDAETDPVYHKFNPQVSESESPVANFCAAGYQGEDKTETLSEIGWHEVGFYSVEIIP